MNNLIRSGGLALIVGAGLLVCTNVLLTLAGLISLPLLAASPLGPLYGQIAGNVILGAGIASLGLALTRVAASNQAA